MIHQPTHKHRNKSAKASVKTEIYFFAVKPDFRRFANEIAVKKVFALPFMRSAPCNAERA